MEWDSNSETILSNLSKAHLSSRLDPVADFAQKLLVVLHVLEHFNGDDAVRLTVQLCGQVEGLDVPGEHVHIL